MPLLIDCACCCSELVSIRPRPRRRTLCLRRAGSTAQQSERMDPKVNYPNAGAKLKVQYAYANGASPVVLQKAGSTNIAVTAPEDSNNAGVSGIDGPTVP